MRDKKNSDFPNNEHIKKSVIENFEELHLTLSHSSAIQNKVRNFFSNLPSIALIFNEGPGFGDQANTLELLRRVQSFGFSGSVRVLYYYLMVKKMEVLFDLPLFQHFLHLKDRNLTFISFEFYKDNYHTFEKVSLALSGALFTLRGRYSDVFGSLVNPESFFRADIFIEIPPYNSHAPIVRLSNSVKMNKLIKMRTQAMYTKIHNVSEVMEVTRLSSVMDMNTKTAMTRVLLDLKNNRLLTQSVYGINYEKKKRSFNRELILLNLILGIEHAREHSTQLDAKPIVQLVHYDLRDEELKTLDSIINHQTFPEKMDVSYKSTLLERIKHYRLTNRFSVYKVTDAELLKKITVLKDGDTLLISTGALPKPVFDYFLTHSSLPPVQEGLNSETLLKQGGKPYFHAHYLEDWPRDSLIRCIECDLASGCFTPSAGTQQKLWEQESKPDDILGSFIVGSFEKDSTITRHFSEASKKHNSEDNDKVLNVFSRAIDLFNSDTLSRPSLAQIEKRCTEIRNHDSLAPLDNVNVGLIHCQGSSPLSLAIIQERFDLVKQILSESGDVNYRIAESDIPAKWLFLRYPHYVGLYFSGLELMRVVGRITEFIYDSYLQVINSEQFIKQAEQQIEKLKKYKEESEHAIKIVEQGIEEVEQHIELAKGHLQSKQESYNKRAVLDKKHERHSEQDIGEIKQIIEEDEQQIGLYKRTLEEEQELLTKINKRIELEKRTLSELNVAPLIFRAIALGKDSLVKKIVSRESLLEVRQEQPALFMISKDDGTDRLTVSNLDSIVVIFYMAARYSAFAIAIMCNREQLIDDLIKQFNVKLGENERQVIAAHGSDALIVKYNFGSLSVWSNTSEQVLPFDRGDWDPKIEYHPTTG